MFILFSLWFLAVMLIFTALTGGLKEILIILGVTIGIPALLVTAFCFFDALIWDFVIKINEKKAIKRKLQDMKEEK